MIAKFRVYHPDENAIYYFSNFEEIVDWQHGDGYRVENDESCQVTYMQSTGLHDKNGVEIFEGDILYIFQTGTISHNFEAHDENRKVVFFEGSWCIENYENTGKNFGNFIIKNHYPIGLYHTQDEIEVIGNIYENKDLLGVENE